MDERRGLRSQGSLTGRRRIIMPVKLVKKDCGIHWGRTAGPCAKCAAPQKSFPPSSLISQVHKHCMGKPISTKERAT